MRVDDEVGKGASDGVSEGAGEGVGDGASDGVSEGAGEGVGDGASEGVHGGSTARSARKSTKSAKCLPKKKLMCKLSTPHLYLK